MKKCMVIKCIKNVVNYQNKYPENMVRVIYHNFVVTEKGGLYSMVWVWGSQMQSSFYVVVFQIKSGTSNFQ